MLTIPADVEFDDYQKRSSSLNLLFSEIENILSANDADFSDWQLAADVCTTFSFKEKDPVWVRISALALTRSIRYMSDFAFSELNDDFETFYGELPNRELPGVMLLHAKIQERLNGVKDSTEIDNICMDFVNSTGKSYRDEVKPKDNSNFLPSAEVNVRALLLNVALFRDKIHHKDPLVNMISNTRIEIQCWNELWHVMEQHDPKKVNEQLYDDTFNLVQRIMQTDKQFSKGWKEAGISYITKTFNEDRASLITKSVIESESIDKADRDRVLRSVASYEYLHKNNRNHLQFHDQPSPNLEKNAPATHKSTALDDIKEIINLSRVEDKRQSALGKTKILVLKCCLNKDYCSDPAFREKFNEEFVSISNMMKMKKP